LFPLPPLPPPQHSTLTSVTPSGQLNVPLALNVWDSTPWLELELLDTELVELDELLLADDVELELVLVLLLALDVLEVESVLVLDVERLLVEELLLLELSVLVLLVLSELRLELLLPDLLLLEDRLLTELELGELDELLLSELVLLLLKLEALLELLLELRELSVLVELLSVDVLDVEMLDVLDVDSVLDERLELLLEPTLLALLVELTDDCELVELSELLELVDRLLVLLDPDWLDSSVSCRPQTRIEYVTSPLKADSRTMQEEALTGNASLAGLCRTKHVCPVAPPLPLDRVGTQASLFTGSVPFTSSLPLPPVCQMASVAISTIDSGWPRASRPSPAPMSSPVKSSRSRSSLVPANSARCLLVQLRSNWSSPAPDSKCPRANMDENTDSASCPSVSSLTMDPVM
jgi:hypothetical protein